MPTAYEDNPPPEGGTAVATVPVGIAPGLARTDVPEALVERIRMAEFLASAKSMVPEGLRDDPGAVLAVMLWASTLDVGVMVAMKEMFVVDGQVGMTSGLMAGLVRRAGHDIRVVAESGKECVLQLIRCDDARTDRIESFTLAEAQSANLLHKLNWQRYRKDMLYARALSRLVRRNAREVVLGWGYTRDELDTPSVAVQAEQDNAEVVEAVEQLRIAALAPAAERSDLIDLGKTARKEFLLRQYTKDGEQVQDLLMRRLSELNRNSDETEPEPDDEKAADTAEAEVIDALDCGCSSAAVVDEGDHRPGCALRRSA